MFFLLQSKHRSILFNAMMKGVLRIFNNSNDSSVYFSSPCIKSITRMAKSHREDPRVRKFENDSCPGVSMINNPGSLQSTLKKLYVLSSSSWSFLPGKNVAPICCVMPPASPSCTFVLRILSRRVVLPVSTCPKMQQMGDRNSPVYMNV